MTTLTLTHLLRGQARRDPGANLISFDSDCAESAVELKTVSSQDAAGLRNNTSPTMPHDLDAGQSWHGMSMLSAVAP